MEVSETGTCWLIFSRSAPGMKERTFAVNTIAKMLNSRRERMR